MTLSVTDLVAAGELAVQAGHLAGAACWPALAAEVSILQSREAPRILGVATLAEVLWQAHHPPQQDETLIVSCAALALQFVSDIRDDAAGIARAYGSGGASLVGDWPKLVRIFAALVRAARGGLSP